MPSKILTLKIFFKHLCFAALPLVVLLLCLEGVFSFLDMGIPFSGTLRMWGAPMKMLEKDEFTIYRPKPNFREGSVVLNSLGCRDQEFNRKADVKILVLGDSVAFGWGVHNPNDTYSGQLEKKLATYLKNQHRTVDVLNAGVPSYKLYQGFQFYLNYLSQITNWDLIIVSFGWNEPLEHDEELEFIRRNPPGVPSWLQASHRLAQRLRSFNVMESAYLRLLARPGGGREEVIFEEYRKLIKDFVVAAQARNSRIVFLSIQPREEDKGNDAEQAMARFNQIAREQVVPGKVFYVDTDDLFSQNRPGFYDNVHFDERGHRLTAEALYQLIVKKLNF